MIRQKYSNEIGSADYGTEVTVAGWIEDVRKLGSVAFIILRDRAGTLQVTALKKEMPIEQFKEFTSATRESVVSVRGIVQQSAQARNGYEILPKEVKVLNLAAAPLPLGVVDKVEADMDTRLDNRFIDLRKPNVQAIFKIRSAVIQAGREYFAQNKFIEVHTPKIISASSEGGTALFKVKYFENDAYLAQSPQLYKQMMMATGLDRVFEIAWYFRAEEHNTRRHLNESTAFDIEMAFINDETDVMNTLEGLVHYIWKYVAENCQTELKTLGKEVKVPTLPFARVSYDDALKLLAERGRNIEWGGDIGTEDEKLLGDIMKENGQDFYFITRYPLAAKPFYAHPEGDKARAFDLEYCGMELSSGAQRVHDPKLLEERIAAKGLNPKDFEAYLKAFKYGMPPHGGFGLGIERILMEMLGQDNIRECILFPRDRTRISP
ncbi:MAG: aspartate--tRNA(Asn) ligase [Candidatus Thermoplasmatota archaeon]|nr:aspartate--tRNA(Asn) ligase [Candidatus Thermoplasmatota archaeon]